MIKTRIDWKGNGYVVAVTRIKDTIYAQVVCENQYVRTMKTDATHPAAIWGLASEIWFYIDPNPCFSQKYNLAQELQQLGQSI